MLGLWVAPPLLGWVLLDLVGATHDGFGRGVKSSLNGGGSAWCLSGGIKSCLILANTMHDVSSGIMR
jgi:hypothetical protein